jgi:hypothetical protein
MKTISITKKWVEEFVIGLNLCPFARKPYQKHQIRFCTTEKSVPEEVLLEFWEEVQLLLDKPGEEISNTLLVLTKVNWDFETFLGTFYVAEELLEEQGLDEIIQLAGFHPDFRFENAKEEEPVNFVNRSPAPMIHLLRVDEVTQAVNSHPDAETITDRNRQVLDKIGHKDLQSRLLKYQESLSLSEKEN